jgi:TRAP-type uncharacterized transport system substrate-binding protein
MGAVDALKSMTELSPDQRKVHIGMGVDIILSLASGGKGPFQKTGPITGWRVLCSLYTTATHFMTLNSKIKTPKDLIGKRVGMPPKGHGMVRVGLFMLDKCWEIKDKVKIVHMPMQMQKDALLDGTVDAVCAGGMYFSSEKFKVSPYNETILAARKNVYCIGLTKEEFETGKAKVSAPFIWGRVKANSLRPGYPDRDWGLLRMALTWYAWEDMDEKVAYEVVRTAGENDGKFKEYFDAGRAARLEAFTANAWSEKHYHPGALKYYKEKGFNPQGTL